MPPQSFTASLPGELKYQLVQRSLESFRENLNHPGLHSAGQNRHSYDWEGWLSVIVTLGKGEASNLLLETWKKVSCFQMMLRWGRYHHIFSCSSWKRMIGQFVRGSHKNCQTLQSKEKIIQCAGRLLVFSSLSAITEDKQTRHSTFQPGPPDILLKERLSRLC